MRSGSCRDLWPRHAGRRRRRRSEPARPEHVGQLGDFHCVEVAPHPDQYRPPDTTIARRADPTSAAVSAVEGGKRKLSAAGRSGRRYVSQRIEEILKLELAAR